MNRKPRFPNYIREWREYRGLTLRDLAARLLDDDGHPLISYASLGRIERGLQPYSQPVVEAIAEALGVPPGVLISAEPASDLAAVSEIWHHLDPRDRERAMHAHRLVLEALLASRKGE